MADPIATMKLCACGCGNPAPPMRWHYAPRFISGHNTRGHRKPRTTFVCIHCGKVTEGTAAAVRGKSFCSANCRDEFRRTRVGPANPRYSQVNVNCPICGKTFPTQPKRLKRRCYTYCSAKCGYEGRNRKFAGAVARRTTSYESGIHAAKKRDKFECRICGFDVVVQGHHIVPRRLGGSHKIENIITLCPNHHAMAHAAVLSTADLEAAMSNAPHDPFPSVYRAKTSVRTAAPPS